jgi:hypothetical protein
MNKLIDLYEKVKQYGKLTKTYKMDGLKQWRKIKPLIQVSTVKAQWNNEVKDIYIDMRMKLKLEECIDEINEDDDKLRHDIWEKHHFYLQHGRIPMLNFNNGRLVRLLQIAYNAGQLSAIFNDPFYTDQMKEYYREMKLDKIDTYMPNESLKLLNESLNEEMYNNLTSILDNEIKKMNNVSNINGGFYVKYKKYKTKYINKINNKDI